MSTTNVALAAAILCAAATIATASDHGERHDHERHGEHRARQHRVRAEGSARGLPTDPEGRALYRKECGACHLDYPPSLLPAESHRRLVASLDRHFGQDAEVEPAVRDRIERFLVEHAADAGGASAEGVTRGAPIRISAAPWFQRKHRGLAERVASSPAIRSLSNCGACHAGAADWDFDDDRVKIPTG